MKKHLANLFTFSRILLSFWLFSFKELTPLYLGIFLYCGLSDALDGFCARKFGTVGNLGATLDTLGDLLLYFGMAKILLGNEKYHFDSRIYFWFIGVVVIFAVSAFTGLGRFKKLYFVHTLTGKLFGIFVFLVPYACFFNLQNVFGCVVCSCATINAAESFAVQAFAPVPVSDIKFAWDIRKLKPAEKGDEN